MFFYMYKSAVFCSNLLFFEKVFKEYNQNSKQFQSRSVSTIFRSCSVPKLFVKIIMYQWTTLAGKNIL